MKYLTNLLENPRVGEREIRRENCVKGSDGRVGSCPPYVDGDGSFNTFAKFTIEGGNSGKTNTSEKVLE